MNSRRPLSSLSSNDLNVSFEFFPPKTGNMEEQLWESISRLERFNPEFVSVTYGAGGSTKEPTLRTVKRIIEETSMKPAAHLTCVDASREEVDSVVREFYDAGVRHFVALRGDSSAGIGQKFHAHSDGYSNAVELVAGLKAFTDFEITVSAYPEKHPESSDFATDIDLLKRKVDNGATRAITQFFFDNDHYERYIEKVRRAGIYIPILPGILPIHNFQAVAKFAASCGASVPASMVRHYEGLDNDPQTRAMVSAALAAEQVMDLVERGINDFHFYTMNRAQLVFAICHLLGVGKQDVNAPEAAPTFAA